MSSETPDGTTLRAEVQFPQNHGGLTHRALVSLGALLVYAPFGWWIEATYPSFAILGGVLAVGIASLPDRLSEWGIPETWTHSLLGALAVGGLLAAGGWWIADHVVYAGRALVTPGAAAQYGFAVGGLATYGHLITDGLTGTDVRPLWPISERGGSVDLPTLVDPRNNDEDTHFIATLVVVAIVVAVTSSTVTATVLSR